MSILDYTDEKIPREFAEKLIRNLYKEADQKNNDLSSEYGPVHIYNSGISSGVIIPTYENLEHAIQSLTNELDDWKKKYISLSKERTILDQTLQAQQKLTEMYQEQLMKSFNRKIE